MPCPTEIPLQVYTSFFDLPALLYTSVLLSYSQHGFDFPNVPLKDSKTPPTLPSSDLLLSITLIRITSSGRKQNSHSHRFRSRHVSSCTTQPNCHNAPNPIITSGKSIALRLAQDGYDVCINDIAANKQGAEEVAHEISQAGRKSTVALGDVSVLSDVQAMVKQSVEELGPLNTMYVCLT